MTLFFEGKAGSTAVSVVIFTVKSLQAAGIYERVKSTKNGIDSNSKLLKDQQDGDEEEIEISGGEKQKIALARALYRDVPVVILDELTSALDPIAEQDIYTCFNDMVTEKTAALQEIDGVIQADTAVFRQRRSPE